MSMQGVAFHSLSTVETEAAGPTDSRRPVPVTQGDPDSENKQTKQSSERSDPLFTPGPVAEATYV